MGIRACSLERDGVQSVFVMAYGWTLCHAGTSSYRCRWIRPGYDPIEGWQAYEASLSIMRDGKSIEC